MESKITQSIWALLLLCLISPSLSAQPFQRIYAYDPGTGLETGIYRDVVCLPYVSTTNVNVVTIGESNIPIQDGVLAFKDQAGNTIQYFEYRSTLGHPVRGVAVDDLPSGPIVAVFYDPVSQAMDVVSTNAAGGVIARTRVPNFEPQDVVCGQAPTYTTGEGVWITGRNTGNNQLAVCAFNGAVLAPVFFNSYFLVDPAWNFNGTLGFEIELDLPTNTLVVAGTATIAGFGARTTSLFARFTPAGAFAGGTSTSDAAGNDFYHGKALTQHPFNVGNYVIAFEYSNTGLPFDRPGLMEVDPAGFPVWMNVYFGAGFFGGTNFITNGVRSDGVDLMVSGFFNSTAAFTSGYALNTDAAGNPITFSEYESTAAFYVPNGTGFWGMDWNVVNGTYYMDGYYNTVNMGGGWPVGPDPRGMWLVSAKNNGNSDCNTQDIGTAINPTPMVKGLNSFTVAMPFPVAPRVKPYLVDPRDVDQCFSPKRHPGGDLVPEAIAQVKVGYLDRSQEILITLDGELTGEGAARLCDLQGRTLAEIGLNGSRHTIDASALSTGVYLLRYEVPGIDRGVKKILVSK